MIERKARRNITLSEIDK